MYVQFRMWFFLRAAHSLEKNSDRHFRLNFLFVSHHPFAVFGCLREIFASLVMFGEKIECLCTWNNRMVRLTKEFTYL